MIVLYILLGLLLLIFLLLCVPVGADIHYENKPAVRLRYGPFGFDLDMESKPKEPKKKKPAAKKPPQNKAAAKKKKEKKPPSPAVQFILDMKGTHGISGLLEFFFGLLRMLTHTGSRLVGLITMPKADLLLVVRGADAAETAILYGQLCAAVYPAFEVLCKLKPCRQQRISIVPDYEKGETEGIFSVSLRVVPILVVWEVLVLAFRAIGHLLRFKPAAPAADKPKTKALKSSNSK